MKKQEKTEKIMNIATKRGFFFPTAEIYNGPAGFWTYGHLGTLMKRKFENLWRCFFLGLNDNYYEIEGSCILPKAVFDASGHLKNFKDPITECKKCKFKFRADQFIEDELNINVEGLTSEAMDKLIQDNKLKCPKCSGDLDNVRWFNMMFELKIGATGQEIGYLSPETAQNPFLSFKRQIFALREKLPMGLAMIGKVFRNEISPRHGFFRLREFNQAELQIFFDHHKINEAEDWNSVKNYKVRLFLVKNRKSNKIVEMSCEDICKELKLPKFYIYHLAKVQQFYLEKLEIPKEKFRFKELAENEKAFYNEIHFDVELDLETMGGFREVAGVHLRGSYDLTQHQTASKEKMEVLIDNKKFIPNILEISFGCDRSIWALMDIFFKEEKERTLFLFPNQIAPIDLAVFPLVSKDKLPEKAEEIYKKFKDEFKIIFDDKGSIGRMYRRVDEIGCPFMITVDHQTLKDSTVTIRNREDMKQIRINTKDLSLTLKKLINKEIEFSKAGNPVT